MLAISICSKLGTSMLVLFVGVSGAGKTSVMQYLRDNFGWKLVPTVTTREERQGETDKVCVSLSIFHKIETNGVFYLSIVYMKTFAGRRSMQLKKQFQTLMIYGQWIFLMPFETSFLLTGTSK